MQQFNYKDIKGLSKLNKDQQFFIKNFIKLANELYKNADKTLMDLLKKQDLNAEELLKNIANIMLKYQVKDDKMNLTLIQQKQLTAKLDKTVNNIFSDEYKEENELITKQLKDQAKDKYNINNYLLAFGMDFTLEKISKLDLEKILKHIIKGKNYSNRIWTNKNDLSKKVKHEIRKFLRGQTNLNSIEKEIRKKFEANKMCTKRLVRNEVARVQNAANEQFFKDNNEFEYLLYSATLDGHTCSKCKEYDGKTFKVNENRPELPLHVNDRCTYILIPNKDYRPSKRLDNETKENIDYKTYKEWENKTIGLKDLPNEYHKNIMDIVDKAPIEAKKVFLKNKDKIKFGDLVYKDTAYFDRENNFIKLNKDIDKNNEKGAYTTTFHEIGHLIDFNSGDISINNFFDKTIRKDAEKFINNVGNYYKIQDEDLREKIYYMIENVKMHSFSDILGGATNNIYRGKFGHKNKYWNDNKNALVKETFAHFFEATIRQDEIKINSFKKYFGNSYNLFLELLKGRT